MLFLLIFTIQAGIFGGAVIDGVFLEDHPLILLESGDFKTGVNVLLGTNQDEGALAALAVYPSYLLADEAPHMNRSDFQREVCV